MAKLRKFSAYRRLERPYTRVSKYREKSYVRAAPHLIITKFAMGNPNKKFSYHLNLVTRQDIQIRQNAIESARMSSNKMLEEKLGRNGYHLKIRIYPFHILRENPLASGAGADRMSTGMARSYGKPIGIAARLKKEQIVFSLDVNKPDIVLGRLALKRAAYKLPCSCKILVNENE